jgi:hypothetical protein
MARGGTSGSARDSLVSPSAVAIRLQTIVDCGAIEGAKVVRNPPMTLNGRGAEVSIHDRPDVGPDLIDLLI